jgi:hypothetical protein
MVSGPHRLFIVADRGSLPATVPPLLLLRQEASSAQGNVCLGVVCIASMVVGWLQFPGARRGRLRRTEQFPRRWTIVGALVTKRIRVTHAL